MVGLATLTRSIGVRIPGGQPKYLKPELPRTPPNILARDDVVVLQQLTMRLRARACEDVRVQPDLYVGKDVG